MLVLSLRAAPLAVLALLAFSAPFRAQNALAGDPVVGVLTTRAQANKQFLLRGTLPVPPGTFPRADGLVPFVLLDPDGTPLLTQVETVARHPGAAEGASVVELIARASRPDVPPGSELAFRVLAHPHRPPPDELGDVPQSVRDLLEDPDGLELRLRDVFGNRYTARPFDGTGSVRVLRHGPIQAEVRIHQTLQATPFVGGPQGTLPHALGVHVYLSFFRGSELVGLDLRFHNGQDGHDAGDPLDDPLDTFYFRELELSVPSAWRIHSDVSDPFLGPERMEGPRCFRTLVTGLPDEKMHVIRWLGQFQRRLALSPDGTDALVEARAYLERSGQAFATRGFDARDGHEYWSWWNHETPAYFPQAQLLPRLDYTLRESVVDEVVGGFDFLLGHLENGTGVGDYPLTVGALGWGHPYGVSYGGMTGGDEIFCYDGITTAWLASRSGFRTFLALHRMQTERMPNALWSRDGEPASVERWVVENGDADYVPFRMFVVPQLFGSNPDPFGVRSAPRFQVDHVRANGLQPYYEGAHFGFEPYDYQHFVRYTRAAKVLAWLGNDSLAKDDLQQQAENFHLAYHEHFSGFPGSVQGSSLRSSQDYVAAHPAQGFPFGRGEAWGLDCAVAAYALGDADFRARKLPWLRSIAELVAAGQGGCNGFIQSFVSNKAVDGKYQARQAIEQSISEHALVGLHESVFRSAYPREAAQLRGVIERSLYAFVSEMSWFPGERGPWRFTGVAPLDPKLPIWCSRADMPSDAWTAGDVETYQDWSSFGYGYRLTGDDLFLRFARIQTGGDDFEDLVERLYAAGTDNLENKAALLAMVQRIRGEL
jgi:hypothetical protein